MKKEMKYLTAAILAVGTIMTSQSINAGVIANDLYLGFQNQANSGTVDYIINLGAASGIIGGSSTVNLSSYFSLANFNTALNGANSMFGGVMSAANGIPADVYATQLRNGVGTPSVPGSTAPAALSISVDDSVFKAISTLNGPAAGAGILDNSLSWENNVEPTLTTGSFYGQSGINPDSSVSPGQILYEDLWYSISSSQTFTYKGYFTLDLSGSTPKLTFTPASAAAQLTAPVISKVNKSAGTTTLIWSTVPTHTYQLQYTASLSPTNWINIGSAVTASGATMTNSDTSAGTNPQRFYRIQAQ